MTSVDKSWICETSGATHLVEGWTYSSFAENQNTGPSHSVDINDRGGGNSEAGRDAFLRASAIGGVVTALVVDNTGDSCSDGPTPGGKKLNVDLYRSGRRVGAVTYRHLEAGTLPEIGSILVPGAVVGDVSDDTGPCYLTTHIHMDWRGIADASDGTSSIDVRWEQTGGVILDEDDVIGTLIPAGPADHPAFKPPPVALEVLTGC